VSGRSGGGRPCNHAAVAPCRWRAKAARVAAAAGAVRPAAPSNTKGVIRLHRGAVRSGLVTCCSACGVAPGSSALAYCGPVRRG
jgi:hypothetical protein